VGGLKNIPVGCVFEKRSSRVGPKQEIFKKATTSHDDDFVGVLNKNIQVQVSDYGAAARLFGPAHHIPRLF
jgi:hypothetical protein